MPGLIYAHTVRRPVRVGADMTPAMANVRPMENIFPQAAPDPVRQSDFVNEGRAEGVARMPIVTAFNIAGINAVQEDTFMAGKLWRTGPNASRPHGSYGTTWDERANIKKTPAVAYGSLFALSPRKFTDTFDARLLRP